MNKVTAAYGSTLIEGPQDEVAFILRLIQDAERKQVRTSARIG